MTIESIAYFMGIVTGCILFGILPTWIRSYKRHIATLNLLEDPKKKVI